MVESHKLLCRNSINVICMSQTLRPGMCQECPLKQITMLKFFFLCCFKYRSTKHFVVGLHSNKKKIKWEKLERDRRKLKFQHFVEISINARPCRQKHHTIFIDSATIFTSFKWHSILGARCTKSISIIEVFKLFRDGYRIDLWRTKQQSVSVTSSQRVKPDDQIQYTQLCVNVQCI